MFTKNQANVEKNNQIFSKNRANIYKIIGKVRWTAATSEVTLAAVRGGGAWRGEAVLLKVASFTVNLEKFILIMKYSYSFLDVQVQYIFEI